MSDRTHTFDIEFATEGRAVGKMRSEVSVTRPGRPGEGWEMATDEGAFHGGDGTAPPPLAYFSTGFTACIMTQIRAFAKRLEVPLDGLTVRGRFAWKGEQVGRQPYTGAPAGFGFDIEIESSAPPEDILRLMECAKNGCFIDQTLSVPNEVAHRVRINGEWIEF